MIQRAQNSLQRRTGAGMIIYTVLVLLLSSLIPLTPTARTIVVDMVFAVLKTHVCDENYQIAADCSLTTCPSGIAWVDKPYGNATYNLGHAAAECSNMGTCNRLTGQCECFAGYEGQACQRAVSYCGEHGFPMTMSDIYSVYSTEMFHDTLNIVAYETANLTFQGWEADKLQACVCDMGYTGPSCNMKMCPKGDDPLTPFTDYYSIKLEIRADSGTLGGYVHFVFNGETLVFGAHADTFTLKACKTLFETLPNIGEVRCTRTDDTDAQGGSATTIHFHGFPVYPHENSLYTNNGNNLLSKLLCKTDYITGDGTQSCTVTETLPAIAPEYEYCSNRGLCDFDTGLCNCYANFTNVNCDTYVYGARAIEALVQKDILVLQNTRSTFTGSVLKLSSNFPAQTHSTWSRSATRTARTSLVSTVTVT